MSSRIEKIREATELKREHAAGLIGRSKRCVQDWERGINAEDPVLVDYLALITGELSMTEARRRALERLQCKKTG